MIIPLTAHMRDAVREFMDAFEQQQYRRIEEVPCDTVVLRANLIKEEGDEYAAAQSRSVEELDALVDLLYVVIGTNLTLNVPVHDYRSGQRPVHSREKLDIYHKLQPMVQDLECRFPCAKIQNRTSNELIARLLDIGTIRSYKMRQAFDAVHSANMGKLWEQEPSDGDIMRLRVPLVGKKKGNKWLVRRATDGKVVKPPNFRPPDLKPFV